MQEDFNPFASPASDLAQPRRVPLAAPARPRDIDEYGPWRQGTRLFVVKDAVLPDRCIKCNEPSTSRLTRTYYWHHPAVYAGILVNVLVYIILAMILRKSVKVDMGFCDECRAKRSQDILIRVIALLIGIALLIIGIVSVQQHELFLVALLLGLVVILVAAVMISTSVTVLTAKTIDDRIGQLEKAGPVFLASLPAWPGPPL